MERQFTASAYIFSETHILLIHHRKFNKWHPPGGHLMPNETPCEAALREAEEETGIKIELISPLDSFEFHGKEARTLARPYRILIGGISAQPNEPAHEHIDFAYLARPVSKEGVVNLEEAYAMRWFTRAEIAALKAPEEIFADARLFILSLFPNALPQALEGAS